MQLNVILIFMMSYNKVYVKKIFVQISREDSIFACETGHRDRYIEKNERAANDLIGISLYSNKATSKDRNLD
jgi:hypothetical protein